MLAILFIATAFLWGFATAAAYPYTTEKPSVVFSSKPIATSIAFAFGFAFFLSGFSILAGISFAAMSAVGSYTAARLPDDNKVKSYFNLSRRW